MIMEIVFITISVISFALGIILVFFPDKLKQILYYILENELFFILGIFEIIPSLLILNFRHNTRIPLVITILGVLLFVDGIFYLLGNKILKETFEIILEIESNSIRYYSIVLFFCALILIFSIF